jgi:hypothetical protein
MYAKQNGERGEKSSFYLGWQKSFIWRAKHWSESYFSSWELSFYMDHIYALYKKMIPQRVISWQEKVSRTELFRLCGTSLGCSDGQETGQQYWWPYSKDILKICHPNQKNTWNHISIPSAPSYWKAITMTTTIQMLERTFPLTLQHSEAGVIGWFS